MPTSETDTVSEIAGNSAATVPHSHSPDAPVTRDSPRVEVENRTAKIVIVDDEEFNIRIVRRYLMDVGYHNFVTIVDSRLACETIIRERPDIVLLDVMMPEINGLEILHVVRNDPQVQHTPVIILTAASDAATKLEALDLGATDFLTKPVDRVELVLRVRNALTVKAHRDHLANYSERLETEVRARTAELEKSRLEVIDCLARAAEYRDGDTGQHVIRVGRYVGILADQLGFKKDYAELMEQAAKLHDVGKIGIPDAILLKPGKLEPEEYAVMKKHCSFGTNIIQQTHSDEQESEQQHTNSSHYIQKILCRDGSPLLTLAAIIAHTHHEKWDGTGYPLGLKGDEIPIEGRILAVADVFDALSSERSYKPAFPLKKCFEIMLEGRGSHFDPNILAAFFTRIKDVVQVFHDLAD